MWMFHQVDISLDINMVFTGEFMQIVGTAWSKWNWITGFQIKIFLWESNGSIWLHMLGVLPEIWGINII